MPNQTRKRQSTRGVGSKSRRFFSVSFLLQLLVILLLCCTAYVLWLDFRIKTEFEGKRWSLPARVYARPLEIYPGLALAPSALEAHLLNSGYKRGAGRLNQGQYRRDSELVSFVRRAFRYWDGQEPARALEVVFENGRVQAILDSSTNESLNLIRLPPQLIGKIYPDHNEDRELFPYEEIPQFLIDALIAVEDRHFFRHNGVDIRGIARAFFSNIRRGRLSQGGSTLTQQLVKNFFLTQERTFRRKFNELIMALLLERRYSKADILSAYINEIYLGQHGSRGIHGFGRAAEFYFAQPLNELRNEQLALLVGMLKGASYYNPRRNPERALERRNLVLQLMQEQGFLQAGEAEKAKNTSLKIAQQPNWSQAKYPAFLQLVKRQLLRDYRLEDLQSEGLRIFTTLEPHIQEVAQKQTARKLKQLEEARSLQTGALESATVIINVATAELIAMVGGRDKNATGFNRALDARRQIGSLVKPFVYLSALMRTQDYNVLTKIEDEEVSLELDNGSSWEPRNYDLKTHGRVTLLEAFANSYNLATVKLGMELGLDGVISTINKAGFKEKIKPYPSLLLGTMEMSPVEVSQMYQVLANGGFLVPLNTIREVLDSHNKTLQRHALEVQQVLPPEPVMLSNYLLKQVVERGTARDLQRTLGDKLPLAGKTGTSNELRDSWFAGYGDDLLAVVWLGHDDNKPTKLTGATGAMQIWADIMRYVQVQPLQLLPPPGVEFADELPVKYEDDCITLSSVPYINGGAGKLRDACTDGVEKKSKSRFNLFEWLR